MVDNRKIIVDLVGLARLYGRFRKPAGSRFWFLDIDAYPLRVGEYTDDAKNRIVSRGSVTIEPSRPRIAKENGA